MRGLAGHSADDDRDVGFQEALANYPGIEIVNEVHTGWSQDTGSQQMLDMIASGIPVDGVWTSGIDNVIVDAYLDSGEPLVPIVGAGHALLPERPARLPERARAQHLDEVYLQTPALALDRLRLEIGHLGELVLDVLGALRGGPSAGNREKMNRAVADVELHADF